MRDSRIGSFGVLALLFSTLIKIAAVHSLLVSGTLAPLLVFPALSRFSMVLAAYRSTYARPTGGLAKPFLEHMTSASLYSASIQALATVLLFIPRIAAPLVLIALAVPAIVRRLSTHRIGGITGDVLGAINEMGEVALLAVAACLSTH